MTTKEKENNETYKTTWWYLKKTENEKDLKEHWKKSFENAEIEDIKKTLDLPNFDYDVFEEITSISKEDFDKRLNNKILFNNKEFVNKEELVEYIKNM